MAPIRDFSRIFGPPRANEPVRGRRRAQRSADPVAPEDDVQRGVGMGYQVIEDYLRQGEQFARGVTGTTNPFGWPPRGANEAAADGADLRTPGVRMLQVAADLIAAWTDLVQGATGGSPAPRRPSPPRDGVPPFDIQPTRDRATESAGASPGKRPGGTPYPRSGGHAGPAARPAPVTVRVLSRRETEIAVDLTPGAAPGPLVAHDLRAPDAAAPRITGVTVQQADGGFVVGIRIDDRQPPGVYAGLVVDPRTNTPRGSLTVRVLPASSPPRRKGKR